MELKILFDEQWPQEFASKLEQDGPWGHWDLFQLAVEMEKDMIIPDFTGLVVV